VDECKAPADSTALAAPQCSTSPSEEMDASRESSNRAVSSHRRSELHAPLRSISPQVLCFPIWCAATASASAKGQTLECSIPSEPNLLRTTRRNVGDCRRFQIYNSSC